MGGPLGLLASGLVEKTQAPSSERDCLSEQVESGRTPNPFLTAVHTHKLIFIIFTDLLCGYVRRRMCAMASV